MTKIDAMYDYKVKGIVIRSMVRWSVNEEENITVWGKETFITSNLHSRFGCLFKYFLQKRMYISHSKFLMANI